MMKLHLVSISAFTQQRTGLKGNGHLDSRRRRKIIIEMRADYLDDISPHLKTP